MRFYSNRVSTYIHVGSADQNEVSELTKKKRKNRKSGVCCTVYTVHCTWVTPKILPSPRCIVYYVCTYRCRRPHRGLPSPSFFHLDARSQLMIHAGYVPFFFFYVFSLSMCLLLLCCNVISVFIGERRFLEGGCPGTANTWASWVGNFATDPFLVGYV